jgi:hypothetical protein
MHGAAYAIAIQTVGGSHEIGNCSTREKYNEHRAKLDAILEWAKSQPTLVRKAYTWGVEMVDKDLTTRLAIHENSRAVGAALATIPKPEGV